jgi:FAD/FMN-containing dehydrogenase
LRCEAGVLLSGSWIGRPRGWFLAVTPGTQFVTIAGAVANDVHARITTAQAPSGGISIVSSCCARMGQASMFAKKNPDWFRATVGGLGPTGLTAWVELQLKAIATR